MLFSVFPLAATFSEAFTASVEQPLVTFVSWFSAFSFFTHLMNLYKCGGKTRLIFTWLLLHSVQWISLKSKALLMAWNTHCCDYQADTNAYRNHSTCKQLMYTWLKCQKKQHWLMHIHRLHALQFWFQWLFITIIVWFPSECVGMRCLFQSKVQPPVCYCPNASLCSTLQNSLGPN